MLLLLTCSHSNLVSVQNTHLLTVHLNTLKAPYCINYVSLSDWLSKDWLPPFLTGIDRLVLCEFPKWKLCLNEGKWVNWSGKLFFMCTCMVMMMMYIWIQRTGISLGAIWQLSLYCNHSILLVSIQATSFSKLSGIKVSRVGKNPGLCVDFCSVLTKTTKPFWKGSCMVYYDVRMVKNITELNLSGTKAVFHLKQSVLLVGFMRDEWMFLVLFLSLFLVVLCLGILWYHGCRLYGWRRLFICPVSSWWCDQCCRTQNFSRRNWRG